MDVFRICMKKIGRIIEVWHILIKFDLCMSVCRKLQSIQESTREVINFTMVEVAILVGV